LVLFKGCGKTTGLLSNTSEFLTTGLLSDTTEFVTLNFPLKKTPVLVAGIFLEQFQDLFVSVTLVSELDSFEIQFIDSEC
jgi:hypothetical protein